MPSGLPHQHHRYTFREEVAHALSHGLGAVLAVVGLAVLASLAAVRGDVWHVVGCSVFGGTLVVLYAASTLYHSALHPRAKAILRLVDHSAIFLLIAGTYTPFTLVNLRGPWGWTLFGVVWGLALTGITLRLTMHKNPKDFLLVLYLAMGWLALVALKPLVASVPPGGLLLMGLGGLAYTAGVPFYRWRSLAYHHAVWHVFVLTGSALHFFAVLYYVIPAA